MTYSTLDLVILTLFFLIYSNDDIVVVTLDEVNAYRPKREIVSKLCEQGLITELVFQIFLIDE